MLLAASHFPYFVANVFPAYDIERDEQACRSRHQQRAAKPNPSDTAPKQEQLPPDQQKAADDEKSAYEYCVQRRAAKAAERQADYAWWGVALSVAGLVGLFGTLIYTAENARAASAAAVAAADGAKVAEETLAATQRPWVSVELSIASGFKIENGEGLISLELSLLNSGLSPAANVEIRAKICAPTEATKAIEEMAQEARLRAEKRRDVPLGKAVGFTLFPKEITPYKVNAPMRRAEIEKALALLPEGTRYIAPNIVGLVSYFSPINRMDHQTGFIYVLMRQEPGYPRGTLIAVQDGEIPARELFLERGMLSGYVD